MRQHRGEAWLLFSGTQRGDGSILQELVSQGWGDTQNQKSVFKHFAIFTSKAKYLLKDGN